ncbi:MAG: imidazolonepropionase [Thermoplasmata archaeon]|nr:imidazolonepropionase [Thermoplasmata archaeon]
MTHTLIVINIGQLVTLSSGPVPRTGGAMGELGIVEDAALVAVDGEITWIGSNDEVEWAGANDILDVRGMCVVPGFVDPHTHLIWAGSREREFEMKLQGATYMEIMEAGGGIHSTVKATREAPEENLVISAMARLDHMLASGTTTVEAKSGYGLSAEAEVKSLRAMREVDKRHPSTIVPTFLGAHAVPEEFKEKGADAYIDNVIEEQLPAVVDEEDGPMAKWCDAFVEEGVFTVDQGERLFEAAKERGLGIRLHADEFVDSGAAALGAKVGAASADHLAASSDDGLEAMAAAGVTATLLPGTPFVLRSKDYARARDMIDKGMAVALATDLNPNCLIDSMPFVMTLACLQMGMTPAEALTASTINAAQCLGLEEQVGSLQVGKRADLVVLDAPSHVHLAYSLNRDVVRTVVKDGHIM